MKLKELRQKSVPELQKLLARNRDKVRDVRFKVSQRQYKNYRELGDLKKEVARILTVTCEKELLEKISALKNK